jgi:hypothetical protein
MFRDRWNLSFWVVNQHLWLSMLLFNTQKNSQKKMILSFNYSSNNHRALENKQNPLKAHMPAIMFSFCGIKSACSKIHMQLWCQKQRCQQKALQVEISPNLFSMEKRECDTKLQCLQSLLL